MSNLPCGISQTQIERETGFTDGGRMPENDACCICRRFLEYDANRGFWRFDDIYGEPATVVSVKHGEYVCGPRCHSQYVFNESTEQEREDMRRLARMCEQWLAVEYSRRQWSFWSYSHLISTADLLNQEMNGLLAAFGMEDGENPPAWYAAATRPVMLEVVSAPDVQMVQQGLGLTDGEAFGPAPLVLFGGGR